MKSLQTKRISKTEYDYYSTEPKAIEFLLELEKFSKIIEEPACGDGTICEILKKSKYKVIPADIVNRGYGKNFEDFLLRNKKLKGNLITNPPYNLALEFINKSLKLSNQGNKIAMFLKLTFLESSVRKQLFTDNPPKTVYISRSRLTCFRNGIIKHGKDREVGIAYVWMIWEKGFKGETILKWFN